MPSNVTSSDIRKIIFENFNDTDTRFSNDDILSHLNRTDKNKVLTDALDFEDVLLDMEKSGMLRPIAQNFNTRYYRLWNRLELVECKSCSFSNYFDPNEEGKACPQCNTPIQ